MSNVMNVSGMVGYALQITQAKSSAVKGKESAAEKSFSEAVTDRTSDVAKTGMAKEISTADMTMEEYKDYVQNKIDYMLKNRHPSQALRSVAINISEAGFEAMKNDPEYEKWVFDSLKTNFDFNDPWASVCGGGYGFHSFGATKEEYRGQSWYAGYQKGHGGDIFDAKTDGSFYKHRLDTSAAEKNLQKYWEEKEWSKAKQRREYLEDILLQRKEMQMLSLRARLF